MTYAGPQANSEYLAFTVRLFLDLGARRKTRGRDHCAHRVNGIIANRKNSVLQASKLATLRSRGLLT